MSLHLICHDHDLSVAQSFEGFWVAVVLLVLKAKDLNNVVDFSILHDLKKKDTLICIHILHYLLN